MDAATAFLQSTRLREVMRAAGVKGNRRPGSPPGFHPARRCRPTQSAS